MSDTSSKSKGEWWFYHLERTSLEEALGPLLEKCLQKDWRVLIVGDEDRLPKLDMGLWTWKAESFLPHARADKAGDTMERQPILLSTTPDPANKADIVVLLDGCRLKDEPADATSYVRCMVVFDGDDYNARDTARTQFKAAKDAGQTVSYFQQNDRGGWDKKG